MFFLWNGCHVKFNFNPNPLSLARSKFEKVLQFPLCTKETVVKNQAAKVIAVRILAINGSCPNRAKDGNCKIHKNREHAAKNFKFGIDDCNAIRKNHGLGPIYLEPVE